jgi:molecular chaperone DnaK
MPTPAVGIDLGTTNSVVAVSINGKPQVLVDPTSGAPLIPSVVSFTESGERLVGRAARVRKAFDPAHTVSSVKRLLGRPFKSEEVRRAKSRVAFDLKEGADSAVLVQTRGGSFSLPEMSAMVLREVRRVAEAALEQKIDRCVVTVPANFNELQRSSTKIAGKIAELEVVRILNEPTAAALAYGYGRGTREKICIYDFGGGTFDVTLLELNGNVFEVLATWGDTFLGGDDIDVAITDAMVPQLLRSTRIDASHDRLAFDILRDAAETAKCRLSQGDASTLDFNYMAPGAREPVRFQQTLTRADLDNLAGPYIERTFSVCQEALKLAGLRPSDLTSVILVGGSTRIHSVRSRVAQFFGREPLTHLPPEEVVALGASILAEALTGGVRKGPTTQRMFAPATASSSPGGSGPLPLPAAPAGQPPLVPPSASAAPMRAPTLMGNAAPPRPPTVTAPFRAPAPPPLPPGARPPAPPAVPSQAMRASQVPGSSRPPSSMPAPPVSPSQSPVSFDLDDPFGADPGERTVAAPAARSAKNTPIPVHMTGFDELDEPSFIGNLPPLGARVANTRPFEQPVPAFNLEDSSVAMPFPSLGATMLQSKQDVEVDPEPTQAIETRPSNVPGLPSPVQPGLPAPAAALPATTAALPTATAGLPMAAAGLPMAAAGLPMAAAGLPMAAAGLPMATNDAIPAKPAIGAPPRPSSPSVQPVVGRPPPEPSGGFASALSSLPPSIAAAIRPPPPRNEAPQDPPMFSQQSVDARPPAGREERSIPSFKLDASLFGDDATLFGNESKPTQAAPGRDASVPSFRIDADDIFGPSSEAGTGTLMARSPFEPTVPERGSSTVAMETPPVTPRIEEPTRRFDPPPSARDESTRVMPTAAADDDASLPPMVVPAAVKAPVPVIRPSMPAPLPSMNSTIQAGNAAPYMPPGGGDTLKPGFPASQQRGPAQAQPLASGAPAATSPSMAPGRASMPAQGGIAVPLLLDVTPLSLGVETAGGQCEAVIRRNATIPVEQTRVFSTTNDDQTTVVIRISQGESRKFVENQGLGELELSGLRPALRGEVSVSVTFELGADGTLTVRAKDVETGREQATRVSLLTIPTETAQAEMAARQRTAVAVSGA